MGEKETRLLRRVRAQATLVRRLGEQIRRESPALPRMQLDGLPRATGGVPGGLDAKLARKDSLERIAARESALLQEYERQAREVMDDMKPEHYAFCALYYLEALPIEDVARAIDRSERQCMRYKREIECGAAENGGKCQLGRRYADVV